MTAQPWPIDWYECRADTSDVAFAKTEGRTIKAGDVLWRVPRSIGPIGIEHNHWAGGHLDISEEDAALVAEAPAMLEALRALLLQALQSELNSPANEWGREAIQDAQAILNRLDNPRP